MAAGGVSYMFLFGGSILGGVVSYDNFFLSFSLFSILRNYFSRRDFLFCLQVFAMCA